MSAKPDDQPGSVVLTFHEATLITQVLRWPDHSASWIRAIELIRQYVEQRSIDSLAGSTDDGSAYLLWEEIEQDPLVRLCAESRDL